MSMNDPLRGEVIASSQRFPSGSSLLFLESKRHLLLLPCFGDREVVVRDRVVLLQQLCGVSACFQKFVGVTDYGGLHLVFEHDGSETLYHRLSQIRSSALPPFSADELLTLMRGMQQSVSFLHRNSVIHYKLHPAVFGLTKLGVRLEGLNAVEVPDENNFETLRKKEVKRLGSCFAAMVTLRDFKELSKLQSSVQFNHCCASPLFTGEVRQIVGEALRSPFILRVNPPLSTQRVLLPPPDFAKRFNLRREEGNREETSVVSSSAESSALSMSSQSASISINSCLICHGAMTFVTPCGHNHCSQCFARHIQSLTQVKPLVLSCKVCCAPLTREFVFGLIEGNKTVVSALDEAIIAEETTAIQCPKCNKYMGDDDRIARNLKCPNCGKNFCSVCKKKPHLFSQCKRIGRIASYN